MNEEDGWLTAAQAAERLGVSESTALMDAKAGRLRSRDRGRGKRPRWLISAAHVDELVSGGGRRDRRGDPADRAVASVAELGLGESAVDHELQAALARANRRITDLETEVARLRVVARNANVAVQAQTESLQQYLLDDHAR